MNGTKRPRARAGRLLGGLAALALALLAPRAAASVPRAGDLPVPVDSFSATAIESPIGVAPLSEGLDLAALERALIPDADVTEAPLFTLGNVVLAELAREQSFGLGPLTLVDVEALRGSPESYPETRIRAFAFLGSTLIGVSRGVSLDLLPGYGRFGLGLAEGDVVNLYAYVGLQPHAATDPTGHCMGLDSLECSDYFKELGGLVSSPAEILESAKRSGGFAWNEVGGFVRAPFEAIRGVAELTGSLIGDPRGTTEGLLAAGKQLLEDPGGTLKAAGSGLLNADPAAAADQAGQMLFDIATAGAARAMRAPRMATGLEDLARVSKLPKASIGRKITDAFEGSRLVRHADEIGRGARRIDAVEDAGHAARSLEKGAQGARHLDDGLGCHLRTRGIGLAMASFAPETPVATADGMKPIQSISPGDEVWALNEKTGERTLRKVLSTVLHLDDDALELKAGGESFLTTADHPFFTASGEWVEAAKLKVGQEVQSLDGDLLRVEKVEKREGRFAVFNFEVDEDHTYFVGGDAVVVHNCGPRVSLRRGLEWSQEAWPGGAAGHYQAGAAGARSSVATGRAVVPGLQYRPFRGGRGLIRFDGIEESARVLIDRKLSVTSFPKQVLAIRRAARALGQNPGYSLRFEVPTEAAARAARRLVGTYAPRSPMSIRVVPFE